MKCEFCDSEANVFFTQILDGKSKKMNLCESCADEHGITSLEDFKLADQLINDAMPKMPDFEFGDDLSEMSGFGKDAADGGSSSSGDSGECPECGFTLANLRQIGRLGCSVCYTSFGGEIKRMLKNMHRGVEHKGKVPTGMIDAMKLRKKVKNLKADLAQAVESEDYEKAASLRDELVKVEKLQTEEVS